MSSVPVSRPSSHPTPDRKPLQPIQLLRVECRAGLEDVIRGHAVLMIVTGDASDSDCKSYWLRADVAHAGHIIGWELQKFVTGERYCLPADCSSCDCADHTFRDDRPGGCRHMVAMRQVVVQLGRTVGQQASGDDPVVEAVADPDDPAWSERWGLAS
jgi:hypothetical protein